MKLDFVNTKAVFIIYVRLYNEYIHSPMFRLKLIYYISRIRKINKTGIVSKYYAPSQDCRLSSERVSL